MDEEHLDVKNSDAVVSGYFYVTLVVFSLFSLGILWSIGVL